MKVLSTILKILIFVLIHTIITKRAGRTVCQMNNHFVKQRITDLYGEFTPVEKIIADYLLSFRGGKLPSSHQIAKSLFVSEASLSRFAQKCGYAGFREFCFNYQIISPEEQTRSLDALSQKVMNSYQTLLDKTIALIDKDQMYRILDMITNAKRVYIYGIGSSGIAAQEFKLRLMRIGLFVEAVTDQHMIRMNSALVNRDCLVMGLSLSGTTKEVITGLRLARAHNAPTVLITASRKKQLKECCDEILPVASQKNLNAGTTISPQYPMLVVLDIFYSYLLQSDYPHRISTHAETLSALFDTPLSSGGI